MSQLVFLQYFLLRYLFFYHVLNMFDGILIIICVNIIIIIFFYQNVIRYSRSWYIYNYSFTLRSIYITVFYDYVT